MKNLSKLKNIAIILVITLICIVVFITISEQVGIAVNHEMPIYEILSIWVVVIIAQVTYKLVYKIGYEKGRLSTSKDVANMINGKKITIRDMSQDEIDGMTQGLVVTDSVKSDLDTTSRKGLGD